ncbi:Non-specific serine/threonine protein kinase [Heracleum sosnowskyi]|uniref:Non-specific serine/threonine protein kinase n=1 Tax=Heracleum sosnowskyi TaxID=360622 RepID=A0AAD8HH62_9APIA|nr:Non-specific serine/threonine protein kinase [Heracleum sosnowskyi]
MGFQVFVLLCWVTLIFAVRGVVVAKVSAADHECRIRRCSHDGPEIRFPFWIRDKQPERCGYPGFQVFCDRGKTLLPVQYLANTSLHGTQMFFSKNVSVDFISYESQDMQLYVYSLTNNLTLVSTSTSLPSAPPHFGEVHHNSYPTYHDEYDEPNTTILNCSSRIEDTITATLTSLDGKTFPVYCVADYIDTNQITSCTKVFNASLPIFLMQGNTTICVPKGHPKIKPIAGIIPAGTLIAVSLVILLYYIIRSYRQRKYDELKFEMFLTDYKAMKPTRYAYADIKKITSNFSDELGQGGYGSVYKGQITKEIIVAVKVLKSDPKANGEDFINEVGTIGRIYHVNVVRLVGYCADGCNRALVYEFQPNNSLEKFTYSGKKQQNDFLGWKKMQEIALGIAKGIEYLGALSRFFILILNLIISC